MFCSSFRYISMGCQNILAEFTLNSCLHNYCHIINSTVMFLVIKSHTICVMTGISQSQFHQFFIHHIHKSFMGACHISSQTQCCITSGSQNSTIKQIPYRYFFPIQKTNRTAIICKTIIRNFPCYGKSII